MQSHKVCILIAAIITISLHSSLADTFNCAQTGSTSTGCPDNTSKCFIKRGTDGSVTRGCGSDNCVAPDCLTCDTNNCNAPLMCRQCDGSQPQCATTNATDQVYNSLCAANQLCRINVNENGTLTRGCGAACTNGDANCKSCDSDNCNVGIFPENRRLCYQCTGEACNTVTATMMTPCSLYQTKDQKCYTIGTDDKTMQRGCTSDAAAKCPIASTDANCAFCDDQNGCNSRPFSSVLGGCIKCNNADTCIQSQATDKAVNCAPVNYTQTQNSCYSQLFSNGTMTRGCTNELNGQECAEAQNCLKCNGAACNTAAGTFTCLTCRSDNYAPCRKAEVGGSPCQNTSLTSESSMQCFEGEWDGVVVRGCLIDLGSLMKFQCENNDDTRCTICKGSNCNKKVYNGAASLQHMGLGLLGLIFLVRNAL